METITITVNDGDQVGLTSGIASSYRLLEVLALASRTIAAMAQEEEHMAQEEERLCKSSL